MTTQPVSKQTQRNWWINAALGGSAIIAALSGIYFLFLPNGGYQGGRNPLYNLQILFTRHTWDDLHTWSGVIMIAVRSSIWSCTGAGLSAQPAGPSRS